jgi:hypothetical protein
MILAREKSLRDYIYSYWCRLSYHLERAPEALSFQQSWTAYKIATSPDNEEWYRSMGFKKNEFFPKRLTERAKHTLIDWKDFKEVHKQQYEFFKSNTHYLNIFVYKYFMYPP